MKKLFAILLAGLMSLSLAACGEDSPAASAPTKTPAATQPTQVSGTADPTTAPEGSAVKTQLFTLSYDDSIWTHVEDDLTDEADYCYATLQVPDPDDSEYHLISAEIEVSIEDPYDFREELVGYGFAQYEYKVNNAYETVKIGGLDLLRYDDGQDTIRYFNRVEGAGATITIEFDVSDISDSRVADLLAGMVFSLEDTGNVDGPWEWEGEPFSTEDHSVTAGSFTVSSKFMPFEKYISTFETFDHNIAALGDKVYVLADGALMECQYDGTVLAFVRPIDLPEEGYDHISATADGYLWLSGSMNDIVRIKDGTVVNTYEDIDNLVMHPSGEWGVDYFVSNKCSIVTFNGDSCTETPIEFQEAGTIMHLTVDQNYIYVCASAADDSGHKVFVYNKDGVLQKTLCDAEGEGLGSITFVTQTANGFIGFDGNLRDVVLWNNDGSFLAEIDGEDLFGTDYPWFCASTVCSDGSILTIMTEEREDKSATEVIVFQVQGF